MDIQWLSPGITHGDALALQQKRVAEVLEGSARETIFLLEHAPVYTIGRTRDTSSLRDPLLLPHPVIEINRGGQATYHGPGQLVAYPIIDLRERGRDLHAYLRNLEEGILRTCRDFGIEACRRPGMTGVWVGDRKLASIGVGVRKWMTMHGLALNVTPESLPPFFAITPCGLEGVRMTCMSHECGHALSVEEVGQTLSTRLRELLVIQR